MSSSITPVFHQEMLRYHLKPSFEYQVEPFIRALLISTFIQIWYLSFWFSKVVMLSDLEPSIV